MLKHGQKVNSIVTLGNLPDERSFGTTRSFTLWCRRCCLGALVSFLVGTFTGGNAHAQFSVCNQSIDVVNVAIGREVDATFQTEGWWTIGANQCADVIRRPLEARYIYVYAMDVFGQSLLNGTTPLCVAKNGFTVRGDRDCWERGLREERFFEVDTQRVDRWTLFIRSPG